MPSAHTSLGISPFPPSPPPKHCYLGRTLKLSAGAGQGNKVRVQRTWVKSGSELLFLSGEWTGISCPMFQLDTDEEMRAFGVIGTP